MPTRAKFRCIEEITKVDGKAYTFSPVTGHSEENKQFFKFTPYGKLEMGIVNPAVQFEVGKEYYLDITIAE